MFLTVSFTQDLIWWYSFTESWNGHYGFQIQRWSCTLKVQSRLDMGPISKVTGTMEGGALLICLRAYNGNTIVLAAATCTRCDGLVATLIPMCSKVWLHSLCKACSWNSQHHCRLLSLLSNPGFQTRSTLAPHYPCPDALTVYIYIYMKFIFFNSLATNTRASYSPIVPTPKYLYTFVCTITDLSHTTASCQCLKIPSSSSLHFSHSVLLWPQ